MNLFKKRERKPSIRFQQLELQLKERGKNIEID